MVKIRLSRFGRKQQPHYRIIVIDERKATNSNYIEKVGIYDPKTKNVIINKEIALKWLRNGAHPSLTVKKLLSKENIIAEFTDEKQKNMAKKNLKKINLKVKKSDIKTIGKKRQKRLDAKKRRAEMHKKTFNYLQNKAAIEEKKESTENLKNQTKSKNVNSSESVKK